MPARHFQCPEQLQAVRRDDDLSDHFIISLVIAPVDAPTGALEGMCFGDDVPSRAQHTCSVAGCSAGRFSRALRTHQLMHSRRLHETSSPLPCAGYLLNLNSLPPLFR